MSPPNEIPLVEGSGTDRITIPGGFADVVHEILDVVFEDELSHAAEIGGVHPFLGNLLSLADFAAPGNSYRQRVVERLGSDELGVFIEEPEDDPEDEATACPMCGQPL